MRLQVAFAAGTLEPRVRTRVHARGAAGGHRRRRLVRLRGIRANDGSLNCFGTSSCSSPMVSTILVPCEHAAGAHAHGARPDARRVERHHPPVSPLPCRRTDRGQARPRRTRSPSRATTSDSPTASSMFGRTGWRTICSRSASDRRCSSRSASSGRSTCSSGCSGSCKAGGGVCADRSGVSRRAPAVHARGRGRVRVVVTQERLLDALLDADGAASSASTATRQRRSATSTTTPLVLRADPEQPRLRHLHVGLDRDSRRASRSRTARSSTS